MNRRAVLALCTLLGMVAAALPARGANLFGVSSRDGVDVVAVGDSGVVFRSVDGGQNFAKSHQGWTPLRAVTQSAATIVIVGDGGKIVSSINSGVSWTTVIAPGAPNLTAVEAATPALVFAAGAGGALLRSGDGGASWTALASGTTSTIRALRFVDAAHGWAVGDGGFIRATADGGDTWSPVSLVTPNALFAIDQKGSRVWAVGASSTCWKSTNGGASWSAVNLRIDSRSDVRGVSLAGPDSVFLAGGGGFIRRSVDDGATWTFAVHPLMGEVSDLFFAGARGWVTSSSGPALLHTHDAGDSWSLATGTTVSRAWSIKQFILAGSQRGSSFALNPVYRNTLYAAIGSRFYVSRDDGETWTQFSTAPGTATRVNAMVMSPRDSLSIVCAVSAPQQIVWSNNGGATWNNALTHPFGEFGIPLEIHPDRPDTLLFGADNDSLFRSTDFGHTWAKWGSKVFRSPCDLIIVPESDSGVVLVGDGITGSGLGDIWRSNDGALSFNRTTTVRGSEVPGMSLGRLAPRRVFATSWVDSGGLYMSTDSGLLWSHPQVTASTWGTDVCDEDPNVVVYGVYSGGTSYLSLDGGASFTAIPLSSSNYGFYARDRNCILAEQGGGLFKLASTYGYEGVQAQAASVVSPNGGEVWAAGSVHAIAWSASNVPVVRIEYRRSPAYAWVPLADVPGYQQTWDWTVPADSTTSAEIRVSDAADATPVDASDSPFTIDVSASVGVESGAPAAFALAQSQPNPFAASARISYTLPRAAFVSLEVFDLQGHRVATLVNRAEGAGLHEVRFEPRAAGGAHLPSGVYFYRLRAGGFSATRKMLRMN